MTELPFGITLLAWSFIVHLALWRMKLPANHTLALLGIFALAPVPVVAAIGSLHPSWLPEDLAAWLRLALLYVPCALGYIVCYSAIEQESATLALAVTLAAAGQAGATQESLQKGLHGENLQERRLASMVKSGLVQGESGGYALTGKGRVLARIFGLVERLAGLPGGG